ncbi:hypothetical protein EXN66_Car006550 [Channa argus]|uniref:Uncharacterized protein n=1 Tax=Channa argus TaxID=215402 RepID=A0A6G1PLJ7_CHAAH|nr:hypothetical protein EXN66_Car006550 [Channa argus]
MQFYSGNDSLFCRQEVMSAFEFETKRKQWEVTAGMLGVIGSTKKKKQEIDHKNKP